MALKLSLLLQAVDRISAPVRKVRDSVQRMGDGVERAARKVNRAGRPVDRLGGKVQGLRNKMLAMLVAANRAAGPNGIDLLGRASDKAGYAVGSLIRKLGGAALGLAKWGAAAGAGATGFAIFDMFKTAGQFEQFQIMLENMEGSAEKARKSMDWVKRFAKETPYELEQVMAAFVQLKAYGIDPMDGTLRSLGDGAAGMNKDLMAAVEALADGVTGEFERLKEFGIRARTEGDRVTLSYMRNGKEVTVQAKKNAAELKAAIVGAMGIRFDGMMARQSKTFFGMISNLKDQWTGFLNRVAEAGVFDKVKARLEQILARIETMAADGRLEDWAQRIGDKLERAFDWGYKFVTETDWQAVADGMAAIVSVLGTIISFIGRAASAWSRWQADVQRKQLENIRDGWLTSSEDRAAAQRGLAELDAREGRAPRRRPASRPKAGSWLENMGKPISPRAAMPRAKLPNSPRASAEQVNVGGKATVLVEVKGQATARLADFSKKGDVPWSIQVARSNWVPS
jgi:phage tail tape-measure protein